MRRTLRQFQPGTIHFPFTETYIQTLEATDAASDPGIEITFLWLPAL